MTTFIFACAIVTIAASIATIVFFSLTLRLMRARDRESRREAQR